MRKATIAGLFCSKNILAFGVIALILQLALLLPTTQANKGSLRNEEDVIDRTEARRLVTLKYLTSDVEPSDPNGGDAEVSSSGNEADTEAEIKPKDEELEFFLGKSTVKKTTKGKAVAKNSPVVDESADVEPTVAKSKSKNKNKKPAVGGVTSWDSPQDGADSAPDASLDASADSDSAEADVAKPSRRRSRSNRDASEGDQTTETEDTTGGTETEITVDSGSDADNEDEVREADDDRAKKGQSEANEETVDSASEPTNSDSPQESRDPLKGIITFPQSARNVNGQLADKTVAVIQMHLEGNVGDQMETIPLLMKLNSWGVTVDAYLSTMQNERKRLNSEVKDRVAPYLRSIHENGLGYDLDMRAKKYDVIIVAPGPPIHEMSHCITSVKGEIENITMAWFLSAVTPRTELSYEKQKYCLSIVILRDTPSEKKFLKMITRSTTRNKKRYRSNIVVGGDIAFSYPVDPNTEVYLPNLEKMKGTLEVVKKLGNDWTLVFTREDNYGKGMGIQINGNRVSISTLDGQRLKLDIEKVIFATSSHLDDRAHIERIKLQHKIHHSRAVVCTSVEDVFALVSVAPHVISDRYHPGIATYLMGKKLTLTMTRTESVRMMTLQRLLRQRKADLIKMNNRAFLQLQTVISRATHPAGDPNPKTITNCKDFNNCDKFVYQYTKNTK